MDEKIRALCRLDIAMNTFLQFTHPCLMAMLEDFCSLKSTLHFGFQLELRLFTGLAVHVYGILRDPVWT
jgi:hypothetical protein